MIIGDLRNKVDRPYEMFLTRRLINLLDVILKNVCSKFPCDIELVSNIS